jgi:hypothetical protein
MSTQAPILLLSSANEAPYAGDGVYVYRQPPASFAATGVATQVGGIFGGFTWGVPNQPYFVNGPQTGDLFDALGRGETGTFPGILTAIMAFEQGRSFCLIRGTDGTDTAAQMLLSDGQGGNYAVLTAVCTGSRPNPTSGPSAYGVLTVSPYSTTGTPLLTWTSYMPDGTTEIFDQLPASSAAAFIAAFSAAINSGTASRGPSAYWVASPGSSTVVPAPPATGLTFDVTTGGTDGSNLTSADALGSGGFVPTGIQAFTGTGVAAFCVAECTDPSIVGTVCAFADQNLAVFVHMLGGLGLTTTAALAVKATNNIRSAAGLSLMDFVTAKDPGTGITTTLTPLGHTLGTLMSINPEESIGNKPRGGLNTVLSVITPSGVPLGSAEKNIRQQNGISYITDQMPRAGGLIGLANGYNSSMTPGSLLATTLVNYTTMTNFLCRNIFATLGPFVDELQSADPTDATDPTRLAATGSLRTFLSNLKSANRITAYAVTADQTNNTQNSIAAGFLNILIQVTYLGTVIYIVPVLQGGTTVLIASTSASAASNAANTIAA